MGETAKTVVGPKLNGIIGSPAGAEAGYKYSDALKESGLTWDEATLAEFLKNPKDIAGIQKKLESAATAAYKKGK